MTAPVDPLEPRLLFTTAEFRDAGILSVTANPGDDVVTVKLLPGQVQISVNAETPLVFNLHSSRPAHNVIWLKVDGLGGNDTLRLDGAINNAFGLVLVGGDGNDHLEAGSERFVANGGAGNDTIVSTGTASPELSGDQGNDTITATGGDCIVSGGSGRDLIQLAGGRDAAWGGPGSDTILGGGGDDTVLGGRGDDSIDGGDGDDWLFGQGGNDTLAGTTGDDHLFGQEGNDSLTGGAGADTIFSGTGTADVTDNSDPLDRVRGREYRRLGRLFDVLVPQSGRPY